MSSDILIDSIEIKKNNHHNYPFNLPLFWNDINLKTNNPVTFFVGENGCGKSSLIKILQAKLHLYEIKIPNQDIKDRIDAKSVTITPSLKKLKGFYFESLTFINYIEYIQKEIADSKAEIERVDREYKFKSEYSKILAKSPYNRTINELTTMYSKDLSKSSHGESYLDFFASRIKDNQIYLLDEPETPLSVQNQLTLMAIIMDAIKRGCQFIIATHSPILTAIPDSLIYEIKRNKFYKTKYENIESIQLLKQFLNNKEQFLKHLTIEEKA